MVYEITLKDETTIKYDDYLQWQNFYLRLKPLSKELESEGDDAKNQFLTELHRKCIEPSFVMQERYNSHVERLGLWKGLSTQELSDGLKRALLNSIIIQNDSIVVVKDPAVKKVYDKQSNKTVWVSSMMWTYFTNFIAAWEQERTQTRFFDHSRALQDLCKKYFNEEYTITNATSLKVLGTKFSLIDEKGAIPEEIKTIIPVYCELDDEGNLKNIHLPNELENRSKVSEGENPESYEAGPLGSPFQRRR